MERSGFFDAKLVGSDYDRVYLAESFAAYFASFISNGVFAEKSDSLQAFAASEPAMKVVVNKGKMFINGYWYENTDDLILNFGVSDGVLNRIDSVVGRLGYSEREIKIVVKKGTPGPNPTAPALTRTPDYHELLIANVRIKAGSVNITQSAITDKRADTTVCGWVTGLISQVDTSTLFKQWEVAYNEAYRDTEKYLEEQKKAWEEFFRNVQADIIIPPPSVADKGKLPFVNAAGNGYELRTISVTKENVTIDKSSFASYSPVGEETKIKALGYNYRASVAVAGVTDDMVPYMTFSKADVDNSGADILNQFSCYNGGVYVYSDVVPNANITALTIDCRRV